MGRYQEHGVWWTAPGKRWEPQTRVEVAEKQRNNALQNLSRAALAYHDACDKYTEAVRVASQPCTCEGQCNNCGGKK
jgi:hypothetical protein